MISLIQIDSRRTDQLEVDGNLVITSRGSLVVGAGDEALTVLASADGLAATINGNISFTSGNTTVSALEILASTYTIKTGSYKPTFQLTLNGGNNYAITAQGVLISGNNLILGSVVDPAAFAATFTANVKGNNDAAAYSYAFYLSGTLAVSSRQFNSVINSTARSASRDARSFGILAADVVLTDVGPSAQFNVSATAGSRSSTQNATAVGVSAENSLFFGDFSARVNVSATAGTGSGADAGEAAALAGGLRTAGAITVGTVANSFTVTAKSGNSTGSSSQAIGIAYGEASLIEGFAADFRMTVSATGYYVALAQGIYGEAALAINGDLNGVWNFTATGGDGVADASLMGYAHAYMIALNGDLQLDGDFNAAGTIRASSNKGQNAIAVALAANGVDISGMLGGSITVDARVTGKGLVLRSGSGVQAQADGMLSSENISLTEGFAANFRLNATANGIDSAEACGIDAATISSSGALAGSWTVSATATGGQTVDGYAGDASAYGIYARMSGIRFQTVDGSKLTLTVNASANSSNQTAITEAVSKAGGLCALSDAVVGDLGRLAVDFRAGVVIGDLGRLTVNARTGRTGGTSVASAVGISGEVVRVGSLSGMSISATAVTSASAVGVSAISGGYSSGDDRMSGPTIEHNFSTASISGAYSITASASAGAATAAGFEADMTQIEALANGSSLTVRATGGNAGSNSATATDAIATGISGGLSMSGIFAGLTVAAVSGRNGTGNTATAYGVNAGSSAVTASFSRLSVSATGVEQAEAVGIAASRSTLDKAGSWSVAASGSAGTARAVGVSGDFDSGDSAASFTVRATGGTFALVNNAPVAGTDSSATAIGIDGDVLDELPALNVAATSGRNAEINNAVAYGVLGDTGSSINGLRRINISANAVDFAQAIGYSNQSLADWGNHSEVINAISGKDSSGAIGYQTISGMSYNYKLSGSLSVNAQGSSGALAIGIGQSGNITLASTSQYISRLTVTASAAGAVTALAVSGDNVGITGGLWGAWTVRANSSSDTATAALLQLSAGSYQVTGLNGTFTVNATGKTNAFAYGFVALTEAFDSTYRDRSFSLTAGAKSNTALAQAAGLAFGSIDYDSGSWRDTIRVTAESYTDADACGISAVATGGTLQVVTNSQFSLTVTARSSGGEAAAAGVSSPNGTLTVSLSGNVNVSATGGRNSSGSTSAEAVGVSGGKGGGRMVSILQTLNVTAQSGNGSTYAADTAATAYGVNFLNETDDTDFSGFVTSDRTRITIKANGIGQAAAAAVAANMLGYTANGGWLTVNAAASGGNATAAGVFTRSRLKVEQGTLKLTVSATAGKTSDPLDTNNNAIAFGLVAGNWDADGNLLNSTDSQLTAAGSGVLFDGILNVNAKAVAGSTQATRKAHAAAFAGDEIIGASADGFKAGVRADAADQRARAFGLQGSGAADSLINFGLEGNWNIAAVASSGTAEAWGGGAAGGINLSSVSAQTRLLVGAQANGIAGAYGFDAADSFVADSFAMTLTVSATSRNNAAAEAIGVKAGNIQMTVSGTIAATASGGDNPYAAGISAATGNIQIDGAVAAAIAKTGNAYAIRGRDETSGGLTVLVSGAIYGGRNANAESVATQLGNLVKSGGSAASLLSSITPATGSSDHYYAVYGTADSDAVRLNNNAISVGDIDLGEGADTLTVSATSQLVGNVDGVETINFLLNSDPGRNPIFTVRDSTGSLNSQLYATLDDAQLGTYILVQGTGSLEWTNTSLTINGTTLALGGTSQLLDTGAWGKLSVVTGGGVSKLVLELTSRPVDREQRLSGSSFVPLSASSSLAIPEEETPLAAGSSSLNFDENYRLYGVGAADSLLGAADTLFSDDQSEDPIRKGLLAG